MVRTQDRVSTRFRNLSGRGESDAIVYRGRAEVTIASFSSWPKGFLIRGETRSSCLTVLELTTPTDGVAWRVVDKLNLRLWEWFRLVFWQVCRPFSWFGLPPKIEAWDWRRLGRPICSNWVWNDRRAGRFYQGSLAATCHGRSPQPEWACESLLGWCWSGWFVDDG